MNNFSEKLNIHKKQLLALGLLVVFCLNMFVVVQQEHQAYGAIHNVIRTDAGDIYTNVYKHRGTLGKGDYIFNAVIPQGKNRCSVKGDVVVIIGKPGINYVTITEEKTHQSLNTLYGGYVTIYVQPISDHNPYASFALECRHETQSDTATIDTATLPAPKVVYTRTGTGQESFYINLPEEFYQCSVTSDSNAIQNLFISGDNIYAHRDRFFARWQDTTLMRGKSTQKYKPCITQQI